MKRDYGIFHVGIFHVALKIALRRGSEVLFLRTSDSNSIDLPGGRIDNTEYLIPLEKIIAREVREELGPQVKYRLGKPAFHLRVYFPKRKIYIFQAVYEAQYISGDIKISSEHSSYQWVNPTEYRFKKKDFADKEAYQVFHKYFSS